ncbi:transglycosylase domain-containing protein [Telluribacter sp. SYSU D00476]|uniref:transglycosylase domain-containing protein n=1 Tax=Telluribacter sp. SYSU D00476 TaxID=2811430 RepID=UPI001FF520ED|nr:transglycosylase domain-containing protein [Telluribacter sp. SYSU D00476]
MARTFWQKNYQRLQNLFSVSYWRQLPHRIRTYNWREVKFKDVLRITFFTIVGFTILFGTACVAFIIAVWMGFFGEIPSRKELRDKRNDTASEVYSADSVLLGRYFIYDRTNVSYNQISPVTFKALVATEDVRFYKHRGVDMRSLGRVAVKTLMMQDESSGGGSTITQQLAKNLYPRRDYRYLEMPINKLREMIMARRLEMVYSKEEILELYLNTVSFGGNIFGIERASRYFFNVPASKLKAEQAAVLIGMLKATTSYNPINRPERAKLRRNVVLNQMAKYKYLTPEKAESLKKLPLKLTREQKVQNENIAPYFREQLRQELAEWCSNQTKPNGDPYNLYTDGLRIYTTIDSRVQQAAERAVRARMAALQKQFNEHWKGRTPWGNDKTVLDNALRVSRRYRVLKEQGLSDEEIREVFRKPVPMTLFSWNGPVKRTMSPMDSLAYYQRFLNTGLVAMNPETGHVLAWVGGINHNLFKYDHVLSKRQVGSTFKPIVYAAALQRGIEPCTYFPNVLTTYKEYEDWRPQNASNRYGGKYSMKGALSNSLNTISAQLILKVGVDPTIRLARNMGIRSELPRVPSIALGTANISLLEIVTSYTAFANEGRRSEPIYVTRIVDRTGRVLRQNRPERGKKVLIAENAALMLGMMKAVVEDGSARRLQSEFGLRLDIAGKTGTTQNQSDGWFIGIVPGLVAGVWVGAESPLVRFRTLELGQGSSTALPVWGDFVSRLVKDDEASVIKGTKFEAITPEIEELLSCASYIPDPPKEDDSFFDRVLESLPFNLGNPERRQERMEQQEIRRQEREEQKERRGNRLRNLFKRKNRNDPQEE